MELVNTLPRGRQEALGILFRLCHIHLFAAIIIRGIGFFAELSGSVVAVGIRVPNTDVEFGPASGTVYRISGYDLLLSALLCKSFKNY
jgi:hypothetical protein